MSTLPTVDLATPPPAPAGTLQGLPRRVALTLPELRLLAEKAGGAPLPFDVAESGAHRRQPARDPPRPVPGRRPTRRPTPPRSSTLHDPTESLTRRGLLDGDRADAGVVGALGLLATPAIALDLDVAAGPVRGRAWHRQRGSAVAVPVHRRRHRLRAGVVRERPLARRAGPDGRRARGHRARRLHRPRARRPPLRAARRGRRGAALRPLRPARRPSSPTTPAPPSTPTASPSTTPPRPRSSPRSSARPAAGCAPWSPTSRPAAVSSACSRGCCSSDGWRVLRPHHEEDAHRVEVRRVEPADLASVLGPVLAEVTA